MKEINLSDYYKPRHYQEEMTKAFRSGKYRRYISTEPRRCGKDVKGLSLMLEYAIQHPGIYWYIWPNAQQGRNHMFNGKLFNGKAFLSLIPEDLIIDKNIADMRITLVNQSTIQIMGIEKVSSLMGGNPRGIVITEFALFDNQEAFELLSPMLRANDGWCMILSTPRRRNAFYSLMQIAQDNPDVWYSQHLTVEDTKHISIAEIEADIARGEMSWEKAQQEYWCSFDVALDNTVYGSGIDRMRAQNRITEVPYDGAYPVMTAWDIGRDMTSIVFWQYIQNRVHIIDYYEKPNENLEFFVKKLQEYPYVYRKHFFPHDGRVTEWAGPKFTRIFKAQRFGLEVDLVERPFFIEDGIEVARSAIDKVWIDEGKCSRLIACLDNYRYKKDEVRNINSSKPLHDWSSHGASAFMYMCMAIDSLQEGMTEEDAERIRREALYEERGYEPGSKIRF